MVQQASNKWRSGIGTKGDVGLANALTSFHWLIGLNKPRWFDDTAERATESTSRVDAYECQGTPIGDCFEHT